MPEYTNPSKINPKLRWVCDVCGKELTIEFQGRSEEAVRQRAKERGWSIVSDGVETKCLCDKHTAETAASE